jgi:hypothetical protein
MADRKAWPHGGYARMCIPLPQLPIMRLGQPQRYRRGQRSPASDPFSHPQVLTGSGHMGRLILARKRAGPATQLTPTRTRHDRMSDTVLTAWPPRPLRALVAAPRVPEL